MQKVSLARMYYPVKVLGPGNRVGIWLNGCDRNCSGCISPEMQEYDVSREIAVADLVRMVGQVKGTIDGFTISGGDPFYRPAALRELVCALEEVQDDILIYTGFTMEELKASQDRDIQTILEHCAAVVDGPYMADKNDNVGLRGSSNQRSFVFRYADRYKDFMTCERSLQSIMTGNRVIMIGIPGGVEE